MTFGATFDFGGDLRPRSEERIYTSDSSSTPVKGDTTNLKLVLPRQLAVGAYYQTSRWAVGLDYVYQNWGGRNKGIARTAVANGGSFDIAYTDTHTVKFGVEFTPSRYARAISSSAGPIAPGFVTAITTRLSAATGSTSMLSPRVRHSRAVLRHFRHRRRCRVRFRGFNVSKQTGLIRQRYFKFAVGFSLFAGSENGEYWFVRPKYD